MLDADNQLLVSPDTLFILPEYKQHGAVFWPDYWTAGAAEEVGSQGIQAAVHGHDGRHSALQSFLYFCRPQRWGGYSALGLPVPWQSDSQWACTESGQILFDRQGPSYSMILHSVCFTCQPTNAYA